MVTFDNALDEAVKGICQWGRKDILREVTLIRDVYGKLALLIDNMQPISDTDSQELERCLEQSIGAFFSKRIYCKKQSHNKKISRCGFSQS